MNPHGVYSWRLRYDINITNSISRLIEYSWTRCLLMLLLLFFLSVGGFISNIGGNRSTESYICFYMEFSKWARISLLAFARKKTKHIHQNESLFICTEEKERKREAKWGREAATSEIVSSVKQSGILINRKIESFYGNNELICSSVAWLLGCWF